MLQELPVIAIVGPTAVGKTSLVLELARKWPLEVISLDSVSVYKGLDIGSAKPSSLERSLVKHHMIDIVSIDEDFSVANYIDSVLPIISAARLNGKIPVLVGGTMMYLHCLENGLKALPESNDKVRQKIQTMADSIGWPAMHEKLASLDGDRAQQIEPNDKQRIARALEVIYLGDNVDQSKDFLGIQLEKIILLPNDRQSLYQIINLRFLKMLESGLVDELVALNSKHGLVCRHRDPRNSVGYKQVNQYLSQQLSWHQMCEKGQTASRNLAKRQLTWLRKMQGTTLFSEDKGSWSSMVADIFCQQGCN